MATLSFTGETIMIDFDLLRAGIHIALNWTLFIQLLSGPCTRLTSPNALYNEIKYYFDIISKMIISSLFS